MGKFSLYIIGINLYALNILHNRLQWPPPLLTTPIVDHHHTMEAKICNIDQEFQQMVVGNFLSFLQ